MSWTKIRWVLVLPAAIAALLIAFALAKIFDDIAEPLGVLWMGFPTLLSDDFDSIFCGVIGGYALVAAGVELAPAGKRYVAFVLASLPTLYSV